MLLTPLLFLTTVYGQSGQGRCTYHDYESYTGKTYDNAPGWCGIRYSVLSVNRITAIHGMNEDGCNQCLQVTGSTGNTIYVLAVDWKGDPGLDIAKSSYMQLFPDQNPLDPNTCQWQRVDPSHCGQICHGTAEECTPGKRNLLPASELENHPGKPNEPIEPPKVPEKPIPTAKPEPTVTVTTAVVYTEPASTPTPSDPISKDPWKPEKQPEPKPTEKPEDTLNPINVIGGIFGGKSNRVILGSAPAANARPEMETSDAFSSLTHLHLLLIVLFQ